MKLALARAQCSHGKVAVLFLDLDGFKPINDRFGYEAGDLALCEVTRRLTSVIRREDTLARVGGAEFVILLSDLGEAPEAAAALVANKCLAIFERPFLLPIRRCTGPRKPAAGSSASEGKRHQQRAARHSTWPAIVARSLNTSRFRSQNMSNLPNKSLKICDLFDIFP